MGSEKSFFSVLPVLPAESWDSHTFELTDGVSIRISSSEQLNKLAVLYTRDTKHCFYLQLEDEGDKSPDKLAVFSENLAALFFNCNYLKIADKPLVLMDESDKDFQNQLSGSIIKAAIDQGFKGVGFSMISSGNNFRDKEAFVYYDLKIKDRIDEKDNYENFIRLFRSGSLTGKILFLDADSAEDFAAAKKKIETIVAAELSKNDGLYELLLSQHEAIIRNTNYERKNNWLTQQYNNGQSFLELAKDSYNHDLSWYISEYKKVKGYYHSVYESMPAWYKKTGSFLLRIAGKKSGK